jgi:ubiquinone/menaquinone biosynthesis C-methylase UbiE/glycosyltransferase involved in cell wall biosynthesis
MKDSNNQNQWLPGAVPVAVVMISLNEAHNMRAVLGNLKGFAQEVILVDSYSVDETVSIALEYGVRVVQRRFRGFGDQWNFAINEMPISAPWTMKIDPDERLSDELKENIRSAIEANKADGFSFERRLWFMGKVLPVRQEILRIWRTGKCRFTDVAVNEHPIVFGSTEFLSGIMEHRDSPDLEHWIEKQNRYSTAEAITSYKGDALADIPKLFGTAFQRRMWLKKNFDYLPMRYHVLFLYHYLVQGAIKAGWPGYAWARMRIEVMRLREYKMREMQLTGRLPAKRYYGPGMADPRVPQVEYEIGATVDFSTIPRGAAYHESLAGQWNDKYRAGGFAKRFRQFHAFLRPNVREGAVWLDAGCGSGILSNEIASFGAQVIALDASPQMINAASEAKFPTKDRIEFRAIESIESMPLSDSLFDGCVCSSVIEYVDSPELALSELSRVMKPNAILFISVANKKSLVRVFQQLIRSIFSAFGINMFSYLDFSVNTYDSEGFKAVLESSGFRVAFLDYTDPVIPSNSVLKHFSSLIVFHAIKNQPNS